MSTSPETYSEAETEARREAALKRMFATPHEPHAPISGKKRKRLTKIYLLAGHYIIRETISLLDGDPNDVMRSALTLEKEPPGIGRKAFEKGSS